MPTENLYSNTEQMFSVPRSLLEEACNGLRITQDRARKELRALLAQSPAQPQGTLDPMDPRRLDLIAYGRNHGLSEASDLCSKMAWAAYYPPGTRYKTFTPKAAKALGDILIKVANDIASLPDGPYERFQARQANSQKTAKT